MGQGLGAAHRGLVTTDHRGPGVARQRQRHGATAARGAQDSPPGENQIYLNICVITVMERKPYKLGNFGYRF